MKIVAVMLLACGAGWAEEPGPGPEARTRRASMMKVEKSLNAHIDELATDSFELLGHTRGVYIEGFGAVFSNEVNLLSVPGATPFGRSLDKAGIAKVHARKIERVSVIKEQMQKMLLASAEALDWIPVKEQIVLSVSLFNLHWEITAGLPSQIVMQAPRNKLLELQRAKAKGAELDLALIPREF
jgi:hypothetical protein